MHRLDLPLSPLDPSPTGQDHGHLREGPEVHCATHPPPRGSPVYHWDTWHPTRSPALPLSVPAALSFFTLSVPILEVWLNPLVAGPPSRTRWGEPCLGWTCPGVSAARSLPSLPPFTGVVVPRAWWAESALSLTSALMKARACRRVFDPTWQFRHDAGSPTQFLKIFMQDRC